MATSLVGKRFGRLTVIEKAPSVGKHGYYKCRCDCGNEITTRTDALTSGAAPSCGCITKERGKEFGKSSIKDLTGKRFGLLTVEKRSENRGRKVVWHCICDCGGERDVPSASLLQGDCTSCGCQQIEQRKKIGVNGEQNFFDGTNIAKIQSSLSGRKYKNNTSGTCGVYWHTCDQKWVSTITFKGHTYKLATTDDKDYAIKARKEAEKHIFEDFLDWYNSNYSKSKKQKGSKNDEKSN